MHLFNHTFPTATQNIAIDEQLLTAVNQGNYSDGILRLWESETYFVVLGLSKKIDLDVNEDECKRDNIPILKRCSGGGTVLQGPGCFNYGYILPIDYADELKSLTNTTTYILNKVKDVLLSSISDIELKGISDLAIKNIKFSGNAQRRLKNAILFHGTILYDFNLDLITKYLKEPPIQPDYRKNRSHRDFIQNLNITDTQLIDLFTNSDHFETLELNDLPS